MAKKYSTNFERDFNWYISMRNTFCFSGKDENAEIKYSRNGVDGKKAFHLFDSEGKLVETRHPNILFKLLKVKSSINLHIKMYAEDRAKGVLPIVEFEKICNEINAPIWFKEAVENQKHKYYA